jgi:hypothetical protein
MVTMVLTAILLAVVIAPLNTVTNVTGSTVSISQATASARAVFQDMNAGVTSASQICLPTQLNSTQTATPGAAVRVKTNVFGTVKWEQWWVNPSTHQLLAQSWTPAATTQPTSWRTVANNVSSVSPPPTPFAISPTSGRISPTGTLTPGTYTATGTTSDGSGDTGTWTYILYVTPTAGTIIQTTPKSGTVTTTGSATFTDQLATGTTGTIYTQSTGNASLTVTSSGLVKTTPVGGLTPGTYTATGTTSDGSGDTGTWAYALNVYTPPTGTTIVQTTPILGTVTTTGSATFTDQLAVAGGSGTVSYVQSTGSPGLTLSALPATNAAVVLTIAITASSGVKSTTVSVPLTSAITTLDTVFAAGAGNCMVGLG